MDLCLEAEIGTRSDWLRTYEHRLYSILLSSQSLAAFPLPLALPLLLLLR